MRVAVISGGRSSEHEVSLRSGESVAAGLEQAGHEVVRILIARDGSWASAEGEPIELRPGRGLSSCDVAFPVLHGPFGEDGSIQGLLEHLDVPYAGPGVLAAATAIDKLVCKRLLAQHGFPQVGFCQAGEPGWRERAEGLGLPLWVKPSRLGSSVGISRVAEYADLDAAVSEAGGHDPRVIIEAHCPGREIECSVLGNETPQTSPPGLVETASGDWYDYQAKYTDGGMRLTVPAPIPAFQAERIRALAAGVFRALDCRGMARCDFFVTDTGEVLVNEINTIPGFTATSVYAKLLDAGGVPYPELCDRLVNLAIERHAEERAHSF